jgi:transposase
VELTGAVILAAELGDITRFDNPRKLMSYLGPDPVRGLDGRAAAARPDHAITKAGNGHARRALVEGA